MCVRSVCVARAIFVLVRGRPIKGVSECIIMGIPIKLGTGLFNLLHRVPKFTPPKAHAPLLFPLLDKRVHF